MSIIFQQLTRFSGGSLPVTIGAGPLTGGHYDQGLHISDSDGVSSVVDGVISYYHAGLPFDADGRLALSGGAPVRVDQSIPFAANGGISADGGAAINYVNQSLAYTSSGAIHVVAAVPPEDVPDKVLNVVVIASIEAASVSWDAAVANPPVDDYSVEYKPNASGTWEVFTPTIGLSEDIYNLEGNVLYDFRVRARNSIGFGPYSDIEMATPTLIAAAKVVEWNEKGVDTNNPVTFMNNTGTGGAAFNLDTIIGNGANLQPFTQKGKNAFLAASGVGIRTAVPPGDFGNVGTHFWCGRATFLDGADRLVWNSTSDQSNVYANLTETGMYQGLSVLGDPMVASGDWIIVASFNADATSSIRIIEDGGIDNTTIGDAGNLPLEPEALNFDFSATGGRDLPAEVYENVFFSGALSASEITSKINALKQKWWPNVPGPQVAEFDHDDFDPNDFD